MLSGLHADAVIEQDGNFIAKLLRRLGVGDGDPGSSLLRETKRCATPDLPSPTTSTRLPLTSIAEFANRKLRHCATFCRCHYRNFSVVRAKSANTSDAIQKRTMTFDSLQPSSSK